MGFFFVNIAYLEFKEEAAKGEGDWKAGRIEGRIKTPEERACRKSAGRRRRRKKRKRCRHPR